MKVDWLNLESSAGDYQTVVDRLNGAPYDELMEIDLYNEEHFGTK